MFHGDLHGGNLFVQPDGRVALLDYGITGRLDELRRLAFLRILMGGTINDPRLQLAALRDLGALPADTDLDAVIRDLGPGQAGQRPHHHGARGAAGRDPRMTKRLLAYGARFPKVLMLFVKDLLFLDGALATLAPDVDLFAEVTAHRQLLHQPLRRAHRRRSRRRPAGAPGRHRRRAGGRRRR